MEDYEYNSIDYSSLEGARNLELVQSTDSLRAIADKLHALAEVVTAGKSVAVATGMLAARARRDAAFTLAQKGMTPAEIIQLRAWQSKGDLPDVHWQDVTVRSPSGRKSAAQLGRRAEALQYLYPKTAVDEDMAYGFALHHPAYMPLVMAVVKMQEAQKVLMCGESNDGALDLVEMQVCHKAHTVAMDVVNKLSGEVRLATRSIQRSKNVLEGRSSAIKRRKKAIDHMLKDSALSR